MKATTVFRELAEMLSGVHAQLTDDEILERTADLVAQAEPMPIAAWLLAYARWRREAVGFTLHRRDHHASGSGCEGHAAEPLGGAMSKNRKFKVPDRGGGRLVLNA